MLQSVKNIALQSLQILYIFVFRGKIVAIRHKIRWQQLSCA